MKKAVKISPVQRLIIAVLALAVLAAVAIPVYFRFNPPQELPDEAWFSEVYQFRTESVSDSENLNALIERMPLPRKILGKEEPRLTADGENRLYLSYRIAGSSSEFMDKQSNKTALDQCAILLFSLVGDLERVSVDITNGDETTAATYDRAWVDYTLDQNVWEDAVSPQRLRTFFVRMQDLNVMAYGKEGR